MDYRKLSKEELIEILEYRDSDNRYKLRESLNKQLSNIAEIVDNIELKDISDSKQISLIVKWAGEGEKIVKGLDALSGNRNKEERDDDFKYIEFMPKD